MEEKALSLENSGSITPHVSISSIDGNGQSDVDQNETQCQEHDEPNGGNSLEEDEEEALNDKNIVIFNGPKSDGLVNYGFFDLEDEDELAPSEGSHNLQHEEFNEIGTGEGGLTVTTTTATTFSRRVDRSGTKIEIPYSLNEEDEEQEEREQERENKMKELSSERNEKQTTNNLLQENSAVVVKKKTITYHTESITVNGVTLESREFIEDNVNVTEKNNPELLSMKSNSEVVESVQGGNEKDPIDKDSMIILENKPTLPLVEAVLDEGVINGVRQFTLESAPEIIKELPGSRQLSQVSNENESSELREPSEEVSLVAKESEPRSSHYHPLLVERVETVEGDAKVDVDIVQIDKESIVMESQKDQETETEAADTMSVIEEESPSVVDKRPPSLHLEAVFDHEEEEGTREKKVEISAEEVEKKPSSLSMEEVKQIINEDSPEVIERRPVSIHMEQMFSEEDRTEVQEPIKEASEVAVESEPRSIYYHSMLEESVDKVEEEDNFHDSFLEVKGESIDTEPEKDLETKNYSDSREVIAEELPFVVDKRPVSFHMEAVFENEESDKDRQPIAEVSPEVVVKRPVSLQVEHLFGEGENTEVREPIKEESTVAVESKPQMFVYHTMLEEKVEEKDDENSVEAGDVLVDIKFEKGAGNETAEMTKSLDTKDEISEEPPHVVEKRPVSLHMEAAFEFEENDEVRQTVEEASPEVVEKRPSSLHMEHLFDEYESTEVREPIKEASTVAVESEPRFLCYHAMLEEKVEDQVGNEDDDDNSVDIGNELVAIKFENGKGKETAEVIKSIDTGNEISEEPHIVIEKPPVPPCMEAAFKLEENHEVKQTIEEASPEVVEKRPVSLHMEHLFDEGESTDDPEPIEEASTFAVESEPRLFFYHSMLEERVEEKDDDQTVNDGNELIDIKYEKGAVKETAEMTKLKTKDEITEELPLVVEKRPASLHMEAAFVLEENDEVRKTVEEASPDVVEKRPVSLHMEHLFDDGEGNEAPEPIEEASSVAVESEPRLFCYHPMLEEKVEVEIKSNEDKSEDIGDELVTIKREKDQREETQPTTKAYETGGVIFEELPLVVQKQPASLNLEPTFDHGENDKVRQTIEEASLEVVEKRPVSLHMEHLYGEGESNDIQEPVEEASTTVVESEPRSLSFHPILEEAEEPVKQKNGDVISPELPGEPKKDEEMDIKDLEAVFDGRDDEGKKPVEDALQILTKEKPTEQEEPVTEAQLVVVERKTASTQPKVLLDHETPGDEFVDVAEEDNKATVESLLSNIESIIEKPSSGQPYSKEVELAPTSDKEPVEEEAVFKIEKRGASLNMGSPLDPEIFGEQFQETYPDTQEKQDIVDEVVTVIVQKKPVSHAFYDEQEGDTQETECFSKDEPPSVVVLDIPQVEKRKEGEDSVKEIAAPVVQKNEVEFYPDLLVLEGEEEQKQKEFDVAHSKQAVNKNWQDTKPTEFITTTTSVVTSIESTDEQSANDSETIVTKTVYEKKTFEAASSSTNSLPDTVTTEEMLSSTSYTKQFHEGNMDGEVELIRYVLRKRLSAPEILPEKESEGSAPLAASEDRGILESQEQFNVMESPRKVKESSLPNRTQGGDESEMEPYTDIPYEEKLIPDSLGEAQPQVADSMEKEEGADETLPVLMLLTPETAGEEKKSTKAKKGGLSSPQCKCCSVM
ncbi:microtubule-associated protein futsch-like [Pocillopora verrucosa]|uniref:microtubule-associated protein futsch-like n=1 Tax=Pocillopora verrucosa TaxID=203993 RepID=UPI003340B48F